MGTGSFGEVEGAPVGDVTLVVSGDVASVRLLSSTGAVLDAMRPSSGVAVLVATGATGLAGSSVVGVDAGGVAVASVATDRSGSGPGPGCSAPAPGTPVPVPTTTTGPTTSTVVAPTATPSLVPATRVP